MKKSSLIVAVTLLSFSNNVHAYPTSAVFSPEGNVRSAGEVQVLAWSSIGIRPAIASGPTWTGIEVGLLPRIAPWFGGLEVGFDAISPYSGFTVKPVINTRLGVLSESDVRPAIAIGFMEFSPSLPSMSLLQASASKTFGSYGRFTAGFGYAAGDQTQHAGTFPFKASSRALVSLAYESPLVWGRLGGVIDHLGGTSELGSTYVGAVFAASKEATVSAGGFASNDGGSGGFYSSISVCVDALSLGKL